MTEAELTERAARFYPDMETLAAFTADLIAEVKADKAALAQAIKPGKELAKSERGEKLLQPSPDSARADDSH